MTVIYMRKKAAILQKYIVIVYTVENDSNIYLLGNVR